MGMMIQLQEDPCVSAPSPRQYLGSLAHEAKEVVRLSKLRVFKRRIQFIFVIVGTTVGDVNVHSKYYTGYFAT